MGFMPMGWAVGNLAGRRAASQTQDKRGKKFFGFGSAKQVPFGFFAEEEEYLSGCVMTDWTRFSFRKTESSSYAQNGATWWLDVG
jgi:hypothetical protein